MRRCNMRRCNMRRCNMRRLQRATIATCDDCNMRRNRSSRTYHCGGTIASRHRGKAEPERRAVLQTNTLNGPHPRGASVGGAGQSPGADGGEPQKCSAVSLRADTEASPCAVIAGSPRQCRAGVNRRGPRAGRAGQNQRRCFGAPSGVLPLSAVGASGCMRRLWVPRALWGL
jgi:hypothetical protein